MIVSVWLWTSYLFAMFASGSVVIICVWHAHCDWYAPFPQSIDMLRQSFNLNLMSSHGVHRHCKARRQLRERCSRCCCLCRRHCDVIQVSLQRVQHLMGHCWWVALCFVWYIFDRRWSKMCQTPKRFLFSFSQRLWTPLREIRRAKCGLPVVPCLVGFREFWPLPGFCLVFFRLKEIFQSNSV